MTEPSGEHTPKNEIVTSLNINEKPFEGDSELVELQEGVWYFPESGIHTKNGNPISEGEYKIVSPNKSSTPQSPQQG